ncbi:MAG: PIG-L family deacetylase [Kiritimatiellae bacterium]|nr:PIG-L family deacetylase [Kiritimatiellia bacterium]
MQALFEAERPVDLRSVGFVPGQRLLVLGPHPDDFDAVGVTLRLFQENGNRIELGVVRTGSGVEDGYGPVPTLEAKAALREQEQRRSCRFFGLPDEHLTVLRLEEDDEAQPLDTPANAARLSAFVLEKRPDFVFLPHGRDTNAGHRRMAAMFARIAAGAGYPIVGFFNRDPKTVAIRTDAYTPFDSGRAEWKARLLRFHDSQHQRNLHTRGHGFDERLLAENRRIAAELGLDAEYAEAFQLEFFGSRP